MESIEQTKDDLEVLLTLVHDGMIVWYGASHRAASALNALSLPQGMIPYVLDESPEVDNVIPGVRIPVVTQSRWLRNADVVVTLEEDVPALSEMMRREGVSPRVVVPFPTPHSVEVQ